MPYDPRSLQEFERLLEPGESFVYVSDWLADNQVWRDAFRLGSVNVPGGWVNVTSGFTVGLTQERMYYATFKNVKKGFMQGKAGYMEVVDHWARPYSNFSNWQFNKNKSNKGLTTGYTFIFNANDGLPTGTCYSNDVASAEKFKEVFEAGVGRFKSVAASPDFAQQLTAMNQLHQEGVLTDAEFQRAKELFLGKSPDSQQQAERTLRSLKQLKDSGVLSEAEYATKKWDVLSEKKLQ
jgi:hypothetical protein